MGDGRRREARGEGSTVIEGELTATSVSSVV